MPAAAPNKTADRLAKIAEDLELLDHKLGALKLAYEQYFLGSRPREPVQLRQEVQKLIAYYSNLAISNTSQRFKFSSQCSRYQAYKRQWDDVLRKIEQGSYTPHRFRADLHQREREHAETAPAAAPASAASAQAGAVESLYASFVAARRQCGQEVQSLSPERFEQMLGQQEAQLRERLGPGPLRFRVVIEEGRAKLKAARVKG